MRMTAPASALLILSACSSVAPAPAEQANATETAAFVEARLEDHKSERVLEDGRRSVLEVAYDKIDLADTGWSWAEKLSLMTGADGVGVWSTQNVKVSVDQKKLGTNVAVAHSPDGWFVRLECQIDKCIHVTGLSSDFGMNAATAAHQSQNKAIDERQAAREWFAKDEDTAKRLAAAIGALVKAQGGRASAF